MANKAIQEMSVQELREQERNIRAMLKEKGAGSMKDAAPEFVDIVRSAYTEGQKVREALETVRNWQARRKELNESLVALRSPNVGEAYKAGYAGSFNTEGLIVHRGRGGAASDGIDVQKALLADLAEELGIELSDLYANDDSEE